MKVKDLFKRDKVKCPDWLGNDFLEDEWLDSEYKFENGVHTWVLKNDFQNLLITFDNNEYRFKAFDDNGNPMFENIVTKDLCCNC